MENTCFGNNKDHLVIGISYCVNFNIAYSDNRQNLLSVHHYLYVNMET